MTTKLTIEASTETSAEASAYVSDRYRQFALTLLMMIFAINFVDRQIINILAEGIKEDLHLADWQIGMMTGLAFALFYSVLGIPIARIAERKNRPYVIAIAITTWSAFTALCGGAQNYVQLLLCRIGVGVGEAGCTPPAHSLITEYTPREKRASAMAFYHMGPSLGMLIGLGMGGIIADRFGWRAAFIFAGVPGILIAIIAALTLREPRHKSMGQVLAQLEQTSSLREVLSFLKTKKSFWLMGLGTGFKAFVAYGHAPFTVSFFLRAHSAELASTAAQFGLKSAGFLGLTLGIIGGVTGMFGTWLGGYISDRAAQHDVRAYGAIPAIASLIGMPLTIAALFAPTIWISMGFLFLGGIAGAIWSGPVHAAILSTPPSHMRATTSSLLLFMLNGIGLGLGPLCVGILSDVLAGPAHLGSAEGVRWALVLSSSLGLVSAALFWGARASLSTDIPEQTR